MGFRVIEVKSLYPGAFKYDIDYPAHQHQARIYHYYLEEEYDLEQPPILWYCDRGGQNTPVEQLVDVSLEAIDGTKREMDTIELVRKNLPELPDRLPRVLKERNYKKQIIEECSGLCNYCDYKGTCKPNESKSTWANRTDTHKPYEATKAANPERLAAFVDTIIKEIL